MEPKAPENPIDKTRRLPAGRRILRELQKAAAYFGSESVVEQAGAHADFFFPFLTDPAFRFSDRHKEIEALGIERLTFDAAEKAARDLDVKQRVTIVTLIPRTPDAKTPSLERTGIGGVIESPTVLQLFIDPNHPAVIESIRTRKARQVAHEMNHIARMQARPESNTLLYGLISEGLATVYEESWDGVFQPAPWHDALTPEQIQTEWEKAKSKDVLMKPRDSQAWFQGERGEHPLWTGYALGTEIVKSYMERHPEKTMREMISLPSPEILRESSFALPSSK